MSISQKQKKVLTSVGAVALSAAILLGGTFAWQSISQEALNEKSASVSAGGRLHDDFNGADKNVYVENFGEEGDSAIFARIKLNEYMETGDGAGLFEEDADGVRTADADNTATPVVSGTSILDKTTWKTHIPSSSGVADCDEAFHDSPYSVKWTMGGGGYYMPTFLTDPDDLTADQRGKWIAPDDDNNYADYKEFYEDETEEGQLPNGDTETHTAKETITGSVISMAQWIASGKTLGNYWVYDTDGWAYWANPIEPGTATGYLLDAIEVGYVGTYYYAIDVIAQFCSPGDLFDSTTEGGAPSENAAALLESINNKALGNSTVILSAPDTITVTSLTFIPADGAYKSSTILMSAAATLDGSNVNVDQDVTWSVNSVAGVTIDPETGEVTISDEATGGASVTVTATSTADSTVSGAYTFTIEADPEPSDAENILAAGEGGVVTLDGIKWVVLNVDETNGEALLWAKTTVASSAFYNTWLPKNSYPSWSTSTVRTYLNDTFATEHPDLAAKAKSKELTTRTKYNVEEWTTTTDQFFLLSEADVYGTFNGSATSDTRDYTLDGATSQLTTAYDVHNISIGYWFRSPKKTDDIARVNPPGSSGRFIYYYSTLGVRPAFFYDLSSD